MSTITLSMTGLTCGHCVQSVKEELSEISGVDTISVELHAGEGETSRATVTTSKDVSDDALRDAITEAGYELTDIER